MNKDQSKAQDLNQYRIKFIYIDAPSNIHTRYFMSYSKEQVQSLLPQITESHLKETDNKYELLSIEKFNRFSNKWEEQ